MNSGAATRGLRICVCGLGYVGAVTAACLARLGHRVVGVDIVASKVDAINQARAPFVENGLDELIAEATACGQLSASTALDAALRESDLTMVCVGTPSGADGALNAEQVRDVCRQIGEELGRTDRYHVVVIRSTLVPGTTGNVLVPLLESASRRTPGRDFGVCVNPEFLREGNAIEDFFQASRTVIGELDQRSGDALASAYTGVPGPVVRTRFEMAELVKYTDNWFHALKAAFANEVGVLASSVGVDGREAMDIFALDRKLNLSRKYLLPGPPFGGSCLPKDLRALAHFGSAQGLNLPLLNAVLRSNAAHMARVLDAIRCCGRRRVGFLGLTFKPGTDDVRESPAVELVAQLISEGFIVFVHDSNAEPEYLVGANLEFLLARIPDLRVRLRASPDALCADVDAVVLMHDTPPYRAALDPHAVRLTVIDCARLPVPNLAALPA